MEIAYYFKYIDSSDAIKSYVSEKLDKLDSRFHHVEGVDSRFEVERQNQIFELTVHADARVFHIKKADKDLYAAIDTALDALNKQVDRHHKKTDDRSPEPPPFEPAIEKEGYEFETTIHVFNAQAKPMDDLEAVLQLQAQNFRFLMYHTSDERRYSLLFHRPDGNYSIIKPTAEAGSYEEHVYSWSGGSLSELSVSLYPMVKNTISDAVSRLRETQADFLAFVNEESSRMNILFSTKNGEIVLQKPAV